MSEGWIKLHRVILENPVLARSQYLAVFIYILLSVNHRERRIIFDERPFVVHAGSGIFSQLKMSVRLKISRRTVARALKYLESAHAIELRTTSRFTLIRVQNWQQYQKAEIQSAHQTRIQRPPDAHLALINKNDKNGKNAKNLHEEKKSFRKMLRWIEGMDGKIVHPKKYVTKIFDTYPERLIERCLQQSNCTSLTMFARNINAFQKEAERRRSVESTLNCERIVAGKSELP